MPDRGLLERTGVRAGPVGPHVEGSTWSLKGVRLAQITFEVSRDVALAFMPGDVGRPVPCYARLVAFDAAVSPAGPLRMAALLVGGRYRMMPRNVLVEGMVDGDLAQVASALGSPFRNGSITMERAGERLLVTVADDQVLARMTLPQMAAVDPAMLRWDPWLGFADADGELQLVEYSLRPESRASFLSKGATVEMGTALSPVHAWRRLRNLNTISSCYLEGDLAIVLPQVQQTIP